MPVEDPAQRDPETNGPAFPERSADAPIDTKDGQTEDTERLPGSQGQGATDAAQGDDASQACVMAAAALDEARRLRAALLRAWRGPDLTQEALGDRIGVTKQTINNWEQGRRVPGRQDLERLSAALPEGEAFVHLWAAAGVVAAGPARETWHRNFPAGSNPGWAWIRCDGRTAPVEVSLRWGVLTGKTEHTQRHRLDPGLLLSFRATVPNPPLQVMLRPPAWVTTGPGAVPERVVRELGLLHTNAADLQTADGKSVPWPKAADPTLTRMQFVLAQTEKFAAAVGLRWQLIRPHLGLFRSDLPPHALDGRSTHVPAGAGVPERDTAGHLTRQLIITRDGLRAMREARGLSREELGQHVTKLLPQHPLTAKQIERMEGGSALPTVEQLVVRLDSVLEADGHIGIERTMPARACSGRPVAVHFPNYWIGAVWVQPIGPSPDATCEMTMLWGLWRRRQVIMSEQVLTTRKALANGEQLIITLPVGWSVVAGTGWPPTALDVNDGWFPRNPAAAFRLLADGVASVLAASGSRRS